MRLHVGPRVYEWTFLIAEVKRPLIGADFLTNSSLLVDLRNKAAGTSGGPSFNSTADDEKKVEDNGSSFRCNDQTFSVGQVVRGVPCSRDAELQDREAQA